jgi:hypothetical protein
VKRSTSITLTIVPALAAVCTGSVPPDPCLPASYTVEACEYAVSHQGYYYQGLFYPHVYPNPYLFYNRAYQNYTVSGGRVAPLEVSRFAPSGVRSGTVRGGFGGAGEAHASAAHGVGAGE